MELFPTLESFSAYIVFLGVMAVLSLIFEEQCIEIEDKIRDFFWRCFKNAKRK